MLGLPIRSKLAIMFVGVCLLTFGVGGAMLAGTSRSALEGEIVARLELESRAVATALDAYLRRLEGRAQDFASDGFIRDALQSLQASPGPEREPLSTELREHLVHNKLLLVPAFADLTLLDARRRPVLSALRDPGVGFLSPLPAGDLADTWSSDLLPQADGGAPRLAIVTPVLSRSGEARIGWLVAWVHMGIWIVDALREPLETAPSGEVALELADRAGNALSVRSELTAPDGPRASSDLVRSGFGLEIVAAGERPEAPRSAAPSTLVRNYAIETNGWSVTVDLKSQSVHAEVARLQARFLAFGVVLTVLACLLFFIPMRFLTRPLMDLTKAARRLAGGDFSARVEAESSDEIGVLTESFNSMARALEDRTQRMERHAQDLRARQADLSSERDRLRAVISSMRDGLVVFDADGVPVVHNRAAGPLLKQVQAGAPPLRPHHKCSNAERSSAPCKTCLFSPEVGPRSCVMEIDGGVFEIHAASLAPDADGRCGRVLVSRDLSDRVAQDERQIHQERLAVLGEVAAVMAHELNNPLAAISMYNQMLGAEIADGDTSSEAVDVIQRNVETCKRTIRDLLTYATPTKPEIQVVDVNGVLEDAAAFLRLLCERSNASLELDLSAEPLEVTGDEVQLRQVFVNLIVNAVQAVGRDGGEVRVETAASGADVEVLVCDTGCGIAADMQERIFRPFYTTKERGEGTGLGLPTARRIVEMNGGRLDLVESGPGGSRFRVRLRLHQREVV